MQSPRATVVVPTRDRAEALRRCLDALARQSLGDELEIVVVQDGGTARLPDVVLAFERVRLVGQEPAGPGIARNLGAGYALAPVVCFTDDDCEPAADWAERLERTIDAGAAVAIGRTVNAEPGARLAAAAQLVVSHLVEHSVKDGRHASFGAANNFACRVEVIREIPFSGRYTFAGGDRDWFRRVRTAGHEVVYEPGALVSHRQRLTLPSFWRQQLAYGRGAYRYRSAQGVPWRLERPGFYGRLLARGFASGPRIGALVVLAQAATAVGFVREATSTRGRASRRPRGLRLGREHVEERSDSQKH